MLENFLSIEFHTLFVPATIAIVAAVLSHWFAVSRQLREQRRQERVEYLSDAFKSLMLFSNNPDEKEASKGLRDAAMLIQFMGTPEQSKMLRGIIEDLKNENTASLDPLLASLRDDLRFELSLSSETGEPIYWTHPKKSD